MRVVIEQRYKDMLMSIAAEVNVAKSKKFKLKKEKYLHDISLANTSVQKKKKRLIQNLHELIIFVFSKKLESGGNKKDQNFGNGLELARLTLQKLESINNYLEECTLKDLGIISRSLTTDASKKREPKKFLQLQVKSTDSENLQKIEHTIYQLIGRIILLDKRLLKDYVKREAVYTKNKKIEIKDLRTVLKNQSRILDMIGAKLPPSSKLTSKMFSKKMFSGWAATILALLASLETDYNKEKQIFIKLNKNLKFKSKLEKKIKHIIHEKQKLLQLEEKRMMSMKNAFKVSDTHRQIFHEFASTADI